MQFIHQVSLSLLLGLAIGFVVTASAALSQESEPAITPRQISVTDAAFKQAAEKLRAMGGNVRTFYERTSSKHWVQIIVDGSEMKSPVDDEAMDAVRLLCTDADTHLHARSCTFTADGFAKLDGTKVSRLELTGPNITDDHLAVLKDLGGLKEFTLTQTSVSDEGFGTLAECKQIESVGIAQNTDISPAALAALARVPNLKSVSIHASLTEDIVTELNKLGHATSLRLTIGDEAAVNAFGKLLSIVALEELTLSGQLVSEEMIVFLAENAPNLKRLYLRGSQGVGVKAAVALAKLPLEVLALDRTNVTDAGVALLKPLRKLRWLDLSQTNVTDRTLIAVGNMTKLKHLDLTATNVSESGLDRLQRLDQLSYISLQRTAVKSIPVWMKERERLYVSFDGGRPFADNPPNAKDDSDLANAVAEFNKQASKHPIGKHEPPLTVNEVVAAIRAWNRNRMRVDDETLAIYQRIAETREMPEGAKLTSTAGWQTPEYRYTVWWVDLQVETGPGRGYDYRLRSRLLSSTKLD